MQTMGGTRLARVPDMSKTIIATYETVPAAAGLTAVAGIVIPGVGLAISGPIAAALAGLGAGGAAGGLLGGLVGLGFTETEAKVVEDAVENGNVVVSITVDGSDRVSVAEGVFKSTSAQSVATA